VTSAGCTRPPRRGPAPAPDRESSDRGAGDPATEQRKFLVRTGNDLHTDDFANRAGGLGARVDRGLHGGDVAAEKRGHIAAANAS